MALNMKAGHIVQNKGGLRQEESLTYVPCDSSPKNSYRLPTIRMDKMVPRKPNLAQAHHERFENINKDTQVVSTNKRTGTHISQLHRDVSESFLNPNMVNVSYSPNVDLTKERVTSLVSIGK
jgi:hypothetical protein